jgi:hypothetical protein
MAGKKAATIIEAARALVEKSFDSIKPEDATPLRKIVTSAYLTTPELHYLHDKLAAYSGKLAMLGFIYSDLALPSPGPVEGAVQLEIPGRFKVQQLEDLKAGLVDVGSGRKFLSISWGGVNPGTLILQRHMNPDCWVEVGNYIDQKEPEAAVTCLLLSSRYQGMPFDALKRDRAFVDRRYWGERSRAIKEQMRDSRSRERGRESDVSRDP